MQDTRTHRRASVHDTLPRSTHAASPQIVRPIIGALGGGGVAGIGLGIALVTGATHAFNMLIWAVFTVLWMACGLAVAVSPKTLDDVWEAARRLPLVIQVGA